MAAPLQDPDPVNNARVVVLDPGHGGNDNGVRGLEGRLEKRVSMALAAKIEDQLRDRYRVVLTRTGDYDMSIAQRASKANHQGGDVFVSLHAGGASRRSASGWGIYCCSSSGARTGGNTPAKPHGEHDWHNLQNKHAGASAMLAQKVRNRLLLAQIQAAPELLEAPLAVLRGVDMPAIVVEYGYLTHPGTAAAYGRDSYLGAAAAAMARGITDFLETSRVRE